MGPAATADFLDHLARRADLRFDHEHPVTIVYSDPTVPDRTAAIDGRGPSPLPSLLAGVRFLADAGCATLVIPCNTAHHWYQELDDATDVPIVHIVDAVHTRLVEQHPRAARIGLLATRGTIASKVYPRRLDGTRFDVIEPASDVIDGPLMGAIGAAKAGRFDESRAALDDVVEHLVDRDVDVLVVACTDLSATVQGTDLAPGTATLDANRALAEYCLRQLTIPLRGERNE